MILFPGDSAGFMDMDGKIKSFFFSSYKDYIGSIKKLSKIKAGILALPHNKYIRGEQRVKEYLKNSLNAAQELKDKILYYLEQNKSFEKTAEDLILEEFPFHSSIQDLIGSGDDLLSNFVRMVKSVSEESGD